MMQVKPGSNMYNCAFEENDVLEQGERYWEFLMEVFSCD
tara:strand:- start:186 stop:302 length:117 start_codon:yes stop_codon:yes gene_type:complete